MTTYKSNKDEEYDPPICDYETIHSLEEDLPPDYLDALNCPLYEELCHGGTQSNGNGQVLICAVCDSVTEKLYYRNVWTCRIRHTDMCYECAEGKPYCPVCGEMKVPLPIADDVPPMEQKNKK